MALTGWEVSFILFFFTSADVQNSHYCFTGYSLFYGHPSTSVYFQFNIHLFQKMGAMTSRIYVFYSYFLKHFWLHWMNLNYLKLIFLFFTYYFCHFSFFAVFFFVPFCYFYFDNFVSFLTNLRNFIQHITFFLHFYRKYNIFRTNTHFLFCIKHIIL